tara:strand:+ start:434 stop:652 length:219 start_codon:yes stop_codon:yes gene_type:complete
MKNLIVSFEKLPSDVLLAFQNTYPLGWEHETFAFTMPMNDDIFTAIRFSNESTNYVIKLEKRKREHPDAVDI